jgi:hypothetical protein
MRQLQYVYFLETRSVRPHPEHGSRMQLGSRSVDRVETLVDGELVIFDLDANTHLPVRIETVRESPLKPPRPDLTATGAQTYVYELDGYHDVSGIRVPGRVTLGGDTAEARVEINPDYEPSIFTKAPPPDSTIDSWRRRADRR